MKQNKPMVIGLLGHAGTGKTYIGRYLAKRLPAEFIEADQVGHRLLETPIMKAQLIQLFGETIVKDETINRQILGKKVFDDREALLALNRLIHPAMYKEIEKLIHQADQPYIILEAAVMIEANFVQLTDYLVEFTTSNKVQLERLINQRHLSEEQAKALLATQRKSATIDTDDQLETTEGLDKMTGQINDLLERIRRHKNETFL